MKEIWLFFSGKLDYIEKKLKLDMDLTQQIKANFREIKNKLESKIIMFVERYNVIIILE